MATINLSGVFGETLSKQCHHFGDVGLVAVAELALMVGFCSVCDSGVGNNGGNGNIMSAAV